MRASERASERFEQCPCVYLLHWSLVLLFLSSSIQHQYFHFADTCSLTGEALQLWLGGFEYPFFPTLRIGARISFADG